MRSRVGALAVLALVACHGEPPAPAGPAGSVLVTDPAADLPAPRRPERRYLLTWSGSRCEIGWEEPTQRSVPFETPCPRSIEPGERIRVTGKTCVRDSDREDRRLPVVCPDPLTNFEKEERGERAREGAAPAVVAR